MVSNDKYFIERFQRDVIDTPRALPSRYRNPYLKVQLGYIPPVHTYAHTLKHPYEIIHYYYKIDDIAETVFQRTSMLGKFRSNDKGEHQLDVMALTPDERADFEGYCKKAATDVYDKLIGFSVPGRRCFLYDMDVYVPMKENEGRAFSYTDANNHAELYRHDTWTLHVTHPDTSHKMDAMQLLMRFDNTYTLTTAKTALSSSWERSGLKRSRAEEWAKKFLAIGVVAYTKPDNTGAETRGMQYLSIVAEVENSTPIPNSLAIEVDVEYKYRIRLWNGEVEVRSSRTRQLFNAELIGQNGRITMQVPMPIKLDTDASAIPGLPAEEIIDLEYYKVERCAVVKLLPEKLDRGDAVIYTDSEGNVSFYAAVRPTDTSAPVDDESLFAPTYDYRHTVHYIVKKPLHIHDDSVAQVDTTILEAMVYRVMYYWSQVTAPQDNKFYLEEWQNCISDLKCRLNSSGPLSITPHPY